MLSLESMESVSQHVCINSLQAGVRMVPPEVERSVWYHQRMTTYALLPLHNSNIANLVTFLPSSAAQFATQAAQLAFDIPAPAL